MTETPRINICIYYIEIAFLYFPFQVEDEHLFSLSFLGNRWPKAWYVVAEWDQKQFEDLIATKVIDKNYLNNHHGRAHHILGTKIILFNPGHLLHSNTAWKVRGSLKERISLSSLLQACIRENIIQDAMWSKQPTLRALVGSRLYKLLQAT